MITTEMCTLLGVATPFVKHHRRQIAAAEQRKSKYLQALAQGLTVADAAAVADVHPKTPTRWAREDRKFKEARDGIRKSQRAAKVAEAREEGGDEAFTPLDGTFTGFRQTMFGWDTYWHQGQIIKAIENADPMELTLINVFPESGKTTLLVDYICYRIAKDPNVRITYVSEGQDLARKVVGQVKTRMTRVDMYPEFIARYGPFHREDGADSDRKWTADAIQVSKQSVDEKDWTLEARGWKSAISGTRADILLIDDLQSVRSKNSTDDMVDTIRQDFLSRVTQDGKVIVVGTRVAEDDVYNRLIELDLISEYVSLPAINHEGESLCPELWSAEKLEVKKKHVGLAVWARTYQQRPEADGKRAFDESAIKRALRDDLGIHGLHTDGRSAIDGLFKVSSLDPALGGQNVLSTAAFDAERLVLLDQKVDDGLARNEDILERVEESARVFRPAVLVVEKNALQRGIARDERLRQLAAKYGFRIHEHETGKNKTDPQYGIAQMPTDFIAGNVWIPNGTDEAKTMFAEFLKQLRRWRPDVPTKALKQDTVMSFWFSWLQFDIRRRGSQSDARKTWKREGVRDFLRYAPRQQMASA